MKTILLLSLLTLEIAGIAQDVNLLWSDEFNGAGAPDSSIWSYNLGATGWGNNEIQNYTDKRQNSRQENGVLLIEAHKSGEEWTSARLVSQNKFNFKYGRIVFKAKLPRGSGTWPALWMLGENITSDGWPTCGEIDVMEHVGKNPGVVQCALHTPSSSGNTVNKKEILVPDYDTEFHLYEANWTEDKINFFVDGKLYYTYEPEVKNKNTWPFDKPFFIIINIAMGGNWGSDTRYETNDLKNGIDPSISTARMEVDYVRIYKNAANE